MALSKYINCQPHRTFEPLYTANIYIVGPVWMSQLVVYLYNRSTGKRLILSFHIEDKTIFGAGAAGVMLPGVHLHSPVHIISTVAQEAVAVLP